MGRDRRRTARCRLPPTADGRCSVRDPELLAQYERDLEMLTRVSHALPGALREAAELSYPLRAASYDTEFVTGGRSVIWCWTHQREVHRCQRHELECTGEPVTVSDPTGEAAVTPGRVWESGHASKTRERTNRENQGELFGDAA